MEEMRGKMHTLGTSATSNESQLKQSETATRELQGKIKDLERLVEQKKMSVYTTWSLCLDCGFSSCGAPGDDFVLVGGLVLHVEDLVGWCRGSEPHLVLSNFDCACHGCSFLLGGDLTVCCAVCILGTQ